MTTLYARARPPWLISVVCAIAAFIAGVLVSKHDGESACIAGPAAQHVVEVSSGNPLSRGRTAPARAIVVASLADDTVWLLQNVADACIIPYAHVDKPTRANAWESVPNRGREASVYLRFIVDHYDNLPDATVFLHGHFSPSWHSTNIAEILRHLDWSQPYANLNFNPEYSVWTTLEDEEGTGLRKLYLDVAAAWPEIFAEVTGQPAAPWPSLSTHCCAQFLLSRESILRHPREWYVRALDWLHAGDARYKGDVANAAIVFEMAWEWIFRPGMANYTHCGDLDCDICGVVNCCVNGSFAQGCAGNLGYEPAYHAALARSYPCGPWAE